MIDLAKVRPGSTLRIPFGSYAAATGAPGAVTNFADADIQVYKDGNTTARASAVGLTAITSFNGLVGINVITVDLSDDTTAGFWSGGSEYFIVVGDITVDGQTLRFPLVRFVIGIRSEILCTTIATLASQTSFTLTAGSADNSAYVGCTAYIHKFNSVVQCCMGVVSAYTGSTKTVTLASDPAIYTMTVKDSVSLFPRANVYAVGGTVQTARDLGATLGVAGAGLTALGDTRIANLDATISSRTKPADTQARVTLADTVTTYAGNTVQTGDTYALANGASGFVAIKAAIAALNNLAAGAAMTLTAGERTALANALLDLADAVETGLTPRQALRLLAAAEGGKVATALVTIRNAVADSKTRISATVDATGNRTAITTDLT
jgi:hypothetical protein